MSRHPSPLKPQAVAALLEGGRITAIARELGLHRWTVNCYAHELGLPPQPRERPRQPLSDRTRSIIAALVTRPGTTYQAVAAEFGLSRERVRQIAAQVGLPPRRRRMIYLRCSQCARVLRAPRTQRLGLCRKHAPPLSPKVTLHCYVCGTAVTRSPSQLNRNGHETRRVSCGPRKSCLNQQPIYCLRCGVTIANTPAQFASARYAQRKGTFTSLCRHCNAGAMGTATRALRRA